MLLCTPISSGVHGPYSPTIFKNILCLFLQIYKFECNTASDWLNQKLCCIQILINVEKSGEQNKHGWWLRTLIIFCLLKNDLSIEPHPQNLAS